MNVLRCASRPIDGQRLLAFAVFRQAISDVVNPATPARLRSSARRFLAGNQMSRFWMSLATGRGKKHA